MESFGPDGQWNCSLCPREYKLNTREHSMLTNAEFYGGVDGKNQAHFTMLSMSCAMFFRVDVARQVC